MVSELSRIRATRAGANAHRILIRASISHTPLLIDRSHAPRDDATTDALRQRGKQSVETIMLISGRRSTCRSVACPAIYRAAVAKSSDPVLPDTPHAQVLLPVPGRSRVKPRSY
nr:hypothetical protein [Tanacetum cinerariifolium]